MYFSCRTILKALGLSALAATSGGRWKLQIKGAVKTSMSLGWRDILNRNSYDQVSTLMCIDTLPGGSLTTNGAAKAHGLTFFHAVLGGRSSVRSWLPVR